MTKKRCLPNPTQNECSATLFNKNDDDVELGNQRFEMQQK